MAPYPIARCPDCHAHHTPRPRVTTPPVAPGHAPLVPRPITRCPGCHSRFTKPRPLSTGHAPGSHLERDHQVDLLPDLADVSLPEVAREADLGLFWGAHTQKGVS